MRFRLGEDVSYCLVDGHPIFLDVAEDRYFRLPEALEHAFSAYVKGDESAPEALRALIDHRVLTDAPEDAHDIAAVAAQGPARSAIELPSTPTRVSLRTLSEVLAIVYSTQRALKTRALKRVLHDLADYRQRQAVAAAPSLNSATEEAYLKASTQFRRARLHVPITPICLLDSIALVKFLARRSLHASIVLGVNCDPFSAHAWVQVGDLALNETVGDANAHTPIRVV